LYDALGSLHITQYGTVTPCCQPWDQQNAFGDINKNSIEEIWNSSGMKKFRLKMLNNQPDGRCNGCYIKEKAGL
jgi:radical SAM protein with 4Fe4S-binding SPASM domain